MKEIKDYGKQPLVINMEEITKANETYRTALWTGQHLQMTLMDIKVGGDIGLEVHPDNDQFLRVEQGQGLVQMGDSKDNLFFSETASDDDGIFIPAGTWHNVTNTGEESLKIYSIYSPAHHPFGTIHATQEIAEAEEAAEEEAAHQND